MRISALVLILTVTFAGCNMQRQSDDLIEMYRTIPPITDVDPTGRNQVSVDVPTKLMVKRTVDTLEIKVDKTTLEPIVISVGSKMETGIECELYVYPVEGTQPSDAGRYGMCSGTEFNLDTEILNTSQGGIPMPGEKYIVEMELAIFETDIPSQHMWLPHSQNYRVLWRRTLRQIVE